MRGIFLLFYQFRLRVGDAKNHKDTIPNMQYTMQIIIYIVFFQLLVSLLSVIRLCPLKLLYDFYMNLTKSKLSKCSVIYASHIQLENAAYIILVSIVLQSMLEHAKMYDW